MKKINRQGFSFIEILVSVAIFAILALAIYQITLAATKVVEEARLIVASAAVANEQLEIIHNLAYADVGLLNGIPAGRIQPTLNITRSNINFSINFYIRNIDDPFDGTLGGTPNDLSPADYKLVQMDISVPADPKFKPISYTEYIAPKNLENSTTNGALFVRVFNANGQPIQGANVHVVNNSVTSTININDTTNDSGILEIVDVPPSVGAYQISVSKAGYSSDQTYAIGTPGNPNPTKPNATVVMQQVTQISFAIDRVSNLTVESLTNTCVPIGNMGFHLSGSKQIGTSPIVLKYQSDFSTDAGGIQNIPNLEWDSYNLSLSSGSYDLAGTIPLEPFDLAPNSLQDLKVVLTPHHPESLMVSVKQGGTQLPLTGATVTLQGNGSSTDLITGRGSLRQTDWSGGPGQANYIDATKFYDSDGQAEISNPAGEVKLRLTNGLYSNSAVLTSSSFDTGSASNFYQISTLPQDQPAQTGPNSVRLQLATNNDNNTWNFVGPDGTAGTYYSPINTNINAIHNGNRYLRYRLYLQTASTTYTPDVSEVNFTFSSNCVPSGQAMFSSLSSGNYQLTVTKAGYQTSTEALSLSSAWQSHEVILMPQ